MMQNFGSISALVVLTTIAWKDDWIREKERHFSVDTPTAYIQSRCGTFPHHCAQQWRCALQIPKYLSPRKFLEYNQSIPRVLWQTWATNCAAGREHFRAINTFIDMNPEYEYFHFNDTDILDFICNFYPHFAAIYQTIVPGAMRADIWRLAIVLKYGGIYVDSDAFTTVPFHDYIWSNTSMVTGLGRSKDVHQWVLMYTPNHEVIARALDIAINKTQQLHRSRQI